MDLIKKDLIEIMDITKEIHKGLFIEEKDNGVIIQQFNGFKYFPWNSIVYVEKTKKEKKS